MENILGTCVSRGMSGVPLSLYQKLYTPDQAFREGKGHENPAARDEIGAKSVVLTFAVLGDFSVHRHCQIFLSF
jgi:hypothetical protein